MKSSKSLLRVVLCLTVVVTMMAFTCVLVSAQEETAAPAAEKATQAAPAAPAVEKEAPVAPAEKEAKAVAAPAKEAKVVPKERTLMGRVVVIKDAQGKVTAAKLLVRKGLIYAIKLDENGNKLAAEMAGKRVSVKGVREGQELVIASFEEVVKPAMKPAERKAEPKAETAKPAEPQAAPEAK